MNDIETIIDPVLAVQVRSVDPPQHIADDWDDIEDGDSYHLNQCDSCGMTVYKMVRPHPETNKGWVVCCGSKDDAEEAFENDNDIDPTLYMAIRKGCGAKYPIRTYASEAVTF